MAEIEVENEFQRVKRAYEVYKTEADSYDAGIRVFIFLGFLTYLSLAIAYLYEEFLGYLFWRNRTNIGIILILIIVLIAWMSRKKEKELSLIELSNEESLLYYSYEASVLLKSYLLENNQNRRNRFLDDAMDNIEDIKYYVEQFDYGNLSFIKINYGAEIDLLKESFKTVNLNESKKVTDDDVDKLIEIFDDITKYVCKNDILLIQEINNKIGNLSDNVKIDEIKHDKRIIKINSSYLSLIIAASISFLIWVVSSSRQYSMDKQVVIFFTPLGILYTILNNLFKNKQESSEL